MIHVGHKELQDLMYLCEGLKNARLSIQEGWDQGVKQDYTNQMSEMDELLESYKDSIVSAAEALFESRVDV